jgi:DNA polymerase
VRIRAAALACHACGLRGSARQVVPDNGVWRSRVLLVGEAPGTVEDQRGLPFVGPSGQYLRKSLSSAGVDPEALFITNVCKCYPPGCRTPTPYEALSCRRHLLAQVAFLQPALIVAVGGLALRAFCAAPKRASVTRLAGQRLQTRDLDGATYPLFALVHPAAVLRNKAVLEPAFRAALERLQVTLSLALA